MSNLIMNNKCIIDLAKHSDNIEAIVLLNVDILIRVTI